MSEEIRPIGEILTPILVEIEGKIWEYEYYISEKPRYTDEGFRAALKIFMSAFLDKMYELQEKEGIDLPERIKMGEKCGEDLRQIIKTYINIDTHELFNSH